MAWHLPVHLQTQPAIPVCQFVEPGALDIDGSIGIVRRVPCMHVIIGAHQDDLMTTANCPDPCQIIEPRGVSAELDRLAKAFDERAPYREARAPASRAAAKGGSV
jgi:hypothetical protein